MKIKYYIVIVFLILIGFIAIFQVKLGLQYSEWITSSAMIGATVAALITAVIALGVSDKPSRKVRFEVNIEVTKSQVIR